MKNKGLFIVVLLLFLITSALAAIGFLTKKNKPTNIKPVEVDNTKITYKYYLEDLEVAQMPTNEKKLDENGNEVETQSYELLKFSCTNDVTGEFDKENWKFVPSEIKESVCQLYFVNSKYRVDFTPIIHAKADEYNPIYIKREENGTFKFIPDEGYKFTSAECTDNKETTWNELTNELTMNSITKDVTCKILFDIRELKANIKVTNGDGTTTETKKFGEKIQVIVKPKEGFENPIVNCTNKQIGVFKDNTLTIEKLTDNTDCTINFNKKAVKKYELSLELPVDKLRVSTGATTQTIEEGKSGSFTIKAEDGYQIFKIDCTDNIVPTREEIDASTTKFTILDIKKNIKCNITAQKSN